MKCLSIITCALCNLSMKCFSWKIQKLGYAADTSVHLIARIFCASVHIIRTLSFSLELQLIICSFYSCTCNKKTSLSSLKRSTAILFLIHAWHTQLICSNVHNTKCENIRTNEIHTQFHPSDAADKEMITRRMKTWQKLTTKLGVWISFSRHSPVKNFHSPSQTTTGPIYRNCQWEGKKPSSGWRVGLCFYSASLNSTRIWQVGEWLSTPLYKTVAANNK
jgi:hypothetical protein